MTSLIKGFVGSLSDALDLNQATLSGCIDIIIVEHEDGKRRSTPFHVRFGKLQLLRSREKLVTIYVNGEKTQLTMKLGRAGEAYFYEQFETDTDAEWSASPMQSPMQSPVASPEKFSDDTFDDQIVIGSIIEELLSAVETSQSEPAYEQVPDEVMPHSNQSLPLPETSLELIQDHSIDVPPPLHLGSSVELSKKPARRSTDRLWSVWSWGWGSLPVRKLASSSSEREDERLMDSIYMEAPRTSSVASVPAQVPAPEHTGRSLSWVSSFIGIFRGKSDVSALAPVPPLVDVRVFVTRRGHVRVQIQPREVRSSSAVIEQVEDSGESAPSEPAQSNTSDAQIFREQGVEMPLSNCVELSLCGQLFNCSDTANKLNHFRANLITHERLCSDPLIVYHPDLIVRYQDLFYPGKVAIPLIISYLAFDRSLTPEALQKVSISTSEGNASNSQHSAGTTFSRPTLESLSVSAQMSLNDSERTIGSVSSDLTSESATISAQVSASESQHNAGGNSDTTKSSFLYRWFGQDGTAVKTTSVEVKNSNDAATDLDSNPDLSEVPETIANANTSETQRTTNESPKMRSHKTLRPTSEMLKLLNLNFGQNLISFCVESALQGMQLVEGFIYLWPESAKIVISDVDGTITRSDLLGNIMPLMGKDWSQVGVTSFFSNIVANGYNILYLTSRAIGQANVTRAFLSSIKQGAISLPQGPVIMSPDSLISSFKREVIYRRPQEFKIPALRDVASLFPEGFCPFVAGFGNRDTDIESYIAVGIPLSMIFIIDPKGSIHRMKSIHRTSYSILNDQVEHMFPPFSKRSSRAHSLFSEFNFWREPIRSLEDLQRQPNDNDSKTGEVKQLKVQISTVSDNTDLNVVADMSKNKR